jgi:hypothetical protein
MKKSILIIFIITGVLAAVLTPALIRARESAVRSDNLQMLRDLGVKLKEFEIEEKPFPTSLSDQTLIKKLDSKLIEFTLNPNLKYNRPNEGAQLDFPILELSSKDGTDSFNLNGAIKLFQPSAAANSAQRSE